MEQQISYEERQKEWVKKHNLKDGDKVKVVRKIHPIGWGNSWVEDMDYFVGREATILDIDGKCGINLKTIGFDEDFEFPFQSLEPVTQKFTKPNLKNGMVVKFRDGDAAINIKTDKFDILTCDGFVEPLSNYSNELIHEDEKDFDIMEVYEAENEFDFSEWENMRCVWKRKEKTDMEIKIEEAEKQIELLKEYIEITKNSK